jgi:polyphenol oxidase
MKIIRSELFQKFPELVFGFSTKIGLNRTKPYDFNLSFTVGDNPENVKQNRDAFFSEVGLKTSQIAFQKQMREDGIRIVEKPGMAGESDALITNIKGLGLTISTADCTAIFIYDKKNEIIAGVHSGWQGTQKKILNKTLQKLSLSFNSQPESLFCFIGPSISQKNYEVGKDVSELFEEKYLESSINPDKKLLDVRQVNIDMLLEFGILKENIEISSLCSFAEKDLLHSYRRDGKLSGRSLGVITMKENYV